MNFLPPHLDAYIEEHSHAPSALLVELERQTHLRCLMPQMCSGYLQGRVLAMISRMLAPKRILEIGTFTGYSALCLAEGLTEDGLLHSVDNNPEVMDMAKEFVERSAYRERIHLHTGTGLGLIQQVHEDWDLVLWMPTRKITRPIWRRWSRSSSQGLISWLTMCYGAERWQRLACTRMRRPKPCGNTIAGR